MHLARRTSAASDGAQAQHRACTYRAEGLMRAGEDMAETARETWSGELHVRATPARYPPVNTPPESTGDDVGSSDTAYMRPRQRASPAASGVAVVSICQVGNRDYQA